MSYPNWACSTIAGRLSKIYHTHGVRKTCVVRQTRNLIRMGLLRSVRGLSWELSGGLVAVIVGRAISAPGIRGGVSLRGIAVQFQMVFLTAVITRLPDWTLISAHGMCQLTKASEACSLNLFSLFPSGKGLEPALGQGFARVGMMGGYFAYNTPDLFFISAF